jgi:hypothetical protein
MIFAPREVFEQILEYMGAMYRCYLGFWEVAFRRG